MSQTKGKLVRVSEDTMKKLKKVGEAFESPNECINRLLTKNPCNTETKEQDIEKESDEESDKESQMENDK